MLSERISVTENVRKPKLDFMHTRLAAIDLGSNGVRLVVAEIHPNHHLKILERVRFPLRLGTDAFTRKSISTQSIKRTVEIFAKFRKILAHHGMQPFQVMAFGTCALREAKNKEQVCEEVYKNTEIDLKIMTGLEEANTLYLALSQAGFLDHEWCLLLDIGGGSVEVTLVKRGIILKTHSFSIGTVRLLSSGEITQKKLLQQFGEELKTFLPEIPIKQEIVFIGTGGNLRQLGKLRKKILHKRDMDEIKPKESDQILEKLKQTGILARIQKFGLNRNRAEVILPALDILQVFSQLTHYKKMLLPNLGLADGILQRILLKEKTKNLILH